MISVLLIAAPIAMCRLINKTNSAVCFGLLSRRKPAALQLLETSVETPFMCLLCSEMKFKLIFTRNSRSHFQNNHLTSRPVKQYFPYESPNYRYCCDVIVRGSFLYFVPFLKRAAELRNPSQPGSVSPTEEHLKLLR